MSDLNCVIQMMGGLGNQLFQYAIGRRLELERSARVRFDLDMYDEHCERALSIRNFRTGIHETSSLDKLSLRLSFGKTTSKLSPVLKPVGSSFLWNLYEDAAAGFDPDVLVIKGRQYLRGYWQAPDYFDSIRPVLLDEFQLADPLPPPDHELQERIAGVNAVCLHVRRGDLLTNPNYSRQTKVQTAEHYECCIREIADRVDDPHFFIFSDDPRWASENIRGHDRITHIDHHDGSTDYIDLHLMSLCRHFIIANSTFSWWGAWLSENDEKIVIVPSVWKSAVDGPPPGLCPASWQIGPAMEHQMTGVK